MRPTHVAALTCATLLSVTLAVPERGDACARVSRRPVRMDGEEALIVWDPRTRTQHFIRSAAFAGIDEDFGFLVPTPARPELAESTSEVFDRLAAHYYSRPRRRRSRRGGTRARAGGGRSSGVRVVERRSVAGLDAAVLMASDDAALDGWLRQHGFPSGAPLRAWLRPYVDRGFYVTAFRYDPASGGSSFRSRAVRMTFRTPRPYFPYSEPQSGDATARPFRVSVLAPTPMAATRFAGAIGYRQRLDRDSVRSLLEDVAPSPFGRSTAWLTVFDERASRRGTDDLYFRADHDGRPVGSRIHTLILGTPPYLRAADPLSGLEGI